MRQLSLLFITFLLLSGMYCLRFNLDNIKASENFLIHNINTGLNYTTIQEAINANETVDGNRIFVDTGTYFENIVVDKSLELIGEGAEHSVIDGNYSGNSVVLVAANGVTLSGFSIRNIFSGTVGVKLYSVRDCNISQNKLENNYIQLDSCENTSILENDLQTNAYGIKLSTSSYNFISRNNINRVGNGVVIELSSRFNSIVGNNITNCDKGVQISDDSDHNRIVGNNLEENQYGVHSWGPSTIIAENVVVGNTQVGLVVARALFTAPTNSNISGNMVKNNQQGGVLVFGLENDVEDNIFINNGLLLYESSQNTVVNNTVNGKPLVYLENTANYRVSDAGQVLLVGCRNITVESLQLSNADLGVQLWNTNSSIILNNYMSGNAAFEGSIYLHGSSNNVLAKNQIAGTGKPGEDGILIENSSNYNTVVKNSIVGTGARLHWGIGIAFSANNSIIENTLQGNVYGISAWESSGNILYHNNLVNNTHQAVSTNCTNRWDNGYPSGGNYWSDFNGADSYSGPFQNETGSDGIGDAPYVIDANNKDGYPFIIPLNLMTQTRVLGSFEVLSSSYFGNVSVETTYSNLRGDFSYPLVCIPADRSISLKCDGYLDNYKDEPLNGKEISLLIDDMLVASTLTGVDSHNLNWTIVLKLSAGLHKGELKFEGDEQYYASSFKFTILGYVDSGFSVTKDAYMFNNWAYSFDEHLLLTSDLMKRNLLDQMYEIPFLVLYPLASHGGHCFGMAASSSAYYLNATLKPKPIDTYNLSLADAVWDINWYHLSQILWWSKTTSVSSSLKMMKPLIDSGIPVVLDMRDVRHAVVIVGYFENADETFLVAYDNNLANSTAVYAVKDGNLMYGSTNMSSAVFVDPRDLPKMLNLTELLAETFKEYIGLQFHSPVNINITSTSGKELLTENNTVVRNDFDDSYIYLSESKIILLPSRENYTMQATGTGNGQVSFDCVYASGNQIVVHQSPNITISNGSKLLLPSLQSGVVYFDSNGDGTIDQTVIIPEIPSFLVPLLLMMAGTLAATVFKSKKPRT